MFFQSFARLRAVRFVSGRACESGTGFLAPVNKCPRLSIYLVVPSFLAKRNEIRPFCFYQTTRFEL